MGCDYLMRDIDSWQAGQPFDKPGHALDPDDLSPDRTQARELTSPYGSLQYCVGDGECFVCFDYAILADNRVALHSVVHSEHYLGELEYVLVQPADAVNVATGLCEQTVQWCLDNEVDYNSEPDYLDSDAYSFVHAVEHALSKLA